MTFIDNTNNPKTYTTALIVLCDDMSGYFALSITFLFFWTLEMFISYIINRYVRLN